MDENANAEKAKAWDEGQAFLIQQAETLGPMFALARAKRAAHFNPYKDDPSFLKEETNGS